MVQWDFQVHLDRMVLKVHLVKLAHQVHLALQVHLAHQQVNLVTTDHPDQWAPLETKVHQVIQVHKVQWANLVL
jgi:hypothetical protein